MAHEDAGHYSAKRQGKKLDERVATSVREKMSGNRISCAEAHLTAGKLNVEPGEVGTAIDLLEVRIINCQLGLFGHGEQKDQKNMPASVGESDAEIESAIRCSLVNGRLPCLAAWKIAERFKVSRATVSGLGERLKIKISPCQLGAFG